MAKGVFLHYPNAGYLEEARNVLKRLNWDIQEKKTDFETVSNLVPYTLQRGAESWLILHHQPESQGHLLILPFPNENDLQLFSNPPEEFPRPIIMELSALIEMFVNNRDFNNNFSQWPNRFQYLRTDVSLDSLLNSKLGQQEERQRIQGNAFLCQETSQNIQKSRERMLFRAQRESNFNVLDELDNVFSKAADKLFEHIRSQRFKEVVPPIVHDYRNVMDSETMRFLITSETVTKFADKHLPSNFDYSAPGCGLWKAVERELNLSLVLHLRREVDIVKSVSMPWKSSENISGKFPILTGDNRSVDLSERESKRSEDLKGMMLGDMQYMLELVDSPF